MWYIIIPLVIFLIILIILKKRENHKAENKSAKTNKITPKLRPESTFKKEETLIDTPHIEPTHPSLDIDKLPELNQIDPVTIHNIELLIAEKKFSLAEALINQTLKQNPNVVALFLYLLDIHLEQDDSIAIDQLFNHLRNHAKHDILEQALTRQNQYLAAKQSETTTSELEQTSVLEIQEHEDQTESESSSLFTELEFEQTTPINIQNIKNEVEPERQDLEFVFEAPVSEPITTLAEPEIEITHEPIIQDNIETETSFQFEAKELDQEPLTTETPETPPIKIVEISDPITKIYPEVADTDEIALNLCIAEQYIKLGAYTAATRLISEQEQDYTQEQREYSQKLLNSIAS